MMDSGTFLPVGAATANVRLRRHPPFVDPLKPSRPGPSCRTIRNVSFSGPIVPELPFVQFLVRLHWMIRKDSFGCRFGVTPLFIHFASAGVRMPDGGALIPGMRNTTIALGCESPGPWTHSIQQLSSMVSGHVF